MGLNLLDRRNVMRNEHQALVCEFKYALIKKMTILLIKCKNNLDNHDLIS